MDYRYFDGEGVRLIWTVDGLEDAAAVQPHDQSTPSTCGLTC